MTATSKPHYVRRGAEVAFSVPAHLESTNWYCFVVRASHTSLDELVGRYLVEPTDGAERFRSLAPYVILYFCHVGRTRLEHAQERLLGSFPYREMGVLVPIFDRKRSEIGAFVPYIWVDSPLAMCAGREIFGYPKGLAAIDVPALGEPFTRLRLRSWALPVFLKTKAAQVLMSAFADQLAGANGGAASEQLVVVVAEDARGGLAGCRLVTPDAYAATAMMALGVVDRVFQREPEPGFRTPAQLCGPEFLRSLPGISYETLDTRCL